MQRCDVTVIYSHFATHRCERVKGHEGQHECGSTTWTQVHYCGQTICNHYPRSA